MKKLFKKIFNFVLLILFFGILLITININIQNYKYNVLVKELGLTRPTGDSRFPLGYFWDKLVPGMSVEEVHEIVIGYELVYICRGTEIYYYYDKRDNKALRFEIIYDWDEELENPEIYFSQMIFEDSSSRTILVKDCELGKMGE